MKVLDLVAAYKALSSEERTLFWREMVGIVGTNQSDDNKSFEIASTVSDYRFSDGVACPHCKSETFIRHGKTKDGVQRYLCRDCGRTFTAVTNTLLSYTHKEIGVWEKYVHCMMDGMTLRKSAEECGISLRASFFWRHKILDCLRNMQDKVRIDGVVEADETFFPLSFKGNHSKSRFNMPRKAHKRGGMSKDVKVCVPSAVNRIGLSVAKVGNLGTPSVESVEGVLSSHLVPNSILCTDGNVLYNRINSDIGFKKHVRIVGGKGKQGVYSIARVNAYHGKLKTWMQRFHGVATKYLNNYLVWNNQVNWANVTRDEKYRTMLTFAIGTLANRNYDAIRKRAPIPTIYGPVSFILSKNNNNLS